jgi:hypothetical protein
MIPYKTEIISAVSLTDGKKIEGRKSCDRVALNLLYSTNSDGQKGLNYNFCLFPTVGTETMGQDNIEKNIWHVQIMRIFFLHTEKSLKFGDKAGQIAKDSLHSKQNQKGFQYKILNTHELNYQGLF